MFHASTFSANTGRAHIYIMRDPDRCPWKETSFEPSLGQVLTATAMDAHNSFDMPQTLMPPPYSARPGASGLVLDLPPKSIVVVTVPSES